MGLAVSECAGVAVTARVGLEVMVTVGVGVLDGVAVTVGPPAIPVPSREATCGLFGALSNISNCPGWSPDPCGVNVILMVHE